MFGDVFLSNGKCINYQSNKKKKKKVDSFLNLAFENCIICFNTALAVS